MLDAIHISRALDALDKLFAARQRESMFAKLHRSRCSAPDIRELDDLVWAVRLDAETVRGSAYLINKASRSATRPRPGLQPESSARPRRASAAR
jgi:hypothetical protein